MFQTMKYVYEVYREQSFSKAARNLYISQPSLSATIKKLEKELGLTIFDRSSVPVRLTEAGEIYLETVKKILNLESELEVRLQNYSGLKAGTIRLGAPHFFASFLLSTMISAFSAKYPGIQIHLDETNTPELQERVLNARTDLIVDSCDFDETLFTSYPLMEEHMLLAVPAGYPINSRLASYRLSPRDIRENVHLRESCPAVSPAAFRKLPFLMLRHGHITHDFAVGLFRKYRFSPKIAMYLDQLMTCYNLAAQQMGASFVSDTVVKLTKTDADVFLYQIDDPKASRLIYLAHKKSRWIPRVVQEFIAVSQTLFPFPAAQKSAQASEPHGPHDGVSP